MLAYSDARGEAGDLLGSKVVRRGGIGAPACGGCVFVGALRWERWVLFNADLGPVDAVTATKGRGRSEQN